MNGPTYNALLKLDKLARANPAHAETLAMVRQEMCRQSEEIRRLKISKKVREQGRIPPYLKTAPCVMVMGSPEVQAEAVCGARGPVDVYRYPSGAITWRKRGTKPLVGAEFVGSYDEASDYRRVVEDMAA